MDTLPRKASMAKMDKKNGMVRVANLTTMFGKARMAKSTKTAEIAKMETKPKRPHWPIGPKWPG